MAPLVLALIVVPVLELAVIIEVGSAIGVLPTILLLIAFSFGGAWLVRREGQSAWQRFSGAISAGKVPASETADGALVILAGAMLITPGFLTDAFGILLLLPPVRSAIKTFGAARLVGSGWRGVAFTAAHQTAKRREPQRSYDVEGTAVDADSAALKR